MSHCHTFGVVTVVKKRLYTTTGWSIETVTYNMSMTYWKTPRRDIQNLLFKNLYWEVWLFTIILLWAKKNWPLRKSAIFFWNQWKAAIYTGCQKNVLSNIQRIFSHFWRPQEKNWCHIHKSFLRVDYIMQTQYWRKNLVYNCYNGLKRVIFPFLFLTFFFHAAI